MPTTIKFTDDEYAALLTVLAYVQGEEEKDVGANYDVPDDFDEKNYQEQIKMMRKADATDHVYYSLCKTYLAIDGEEETESVYQDDEEEDGCNRCGDQDIEYCHKQEEYLCVEHLKVLGCGDCKTCRVDETKEDVEEKINLTVGA